MILNIGGGGGLPIRLIVTAPTGSAVSVTQGSTVLAANEVDGVWTFAIPSLGVWTIHATIEGQSLTQDVDISKVGQYNVTLEAPVKATLNDNDWATIKEVAEKSQGPNYWSVGDTKQITINGKLSDGLTLSNYSTYVYIIGFDHNSGKEGTGIAFQGFKTAQSGGTDICLCDSGYAYSKSSGQWFNMNNNNSTSGGWNGCNMRNNTLPVVKATLPAELTSVIKTTTLYTDNTGGGSTSASYVTATQDTLYLLAEFEISGAHTYANTAEQNYQKQYAYYAAGNSKVKYRHNSTADAAWWWDRSVDATNINSFSIIASDSSTGTGAALYSFGLAPAFKVGGAKYTPLEYIQSTGTQYIDTGVAINSTTYNKLEFEEDVLYPSLSSTYYLVNGASGSNVIYYYGLNNSNGAVVYGDGTADKTTSYTVSANERYTVVFSPATGKYTFGSNPSVSFTPVSMTGNSNFYVFAYNKGSTQDCHIERLYSLKIRMDGELIRDFIPAKDEVGNVGLYDKIGEKFYYNSGTGTFAIPGVRQANSVGIGASLFAEENGTKTEFIVVNQGNPNTSKYDSTCDGTWLVRKDIYGTCTFGASSVIYDGSIVDQEMERYLTKLNISSIIKTVNVPVIKSTTELLTASVQCFALSAIECGVSAYADGTRLSYFAEESNRIAYYNGVATAHWTRSPYYSTDTGTYNSKYATLVTKTGTSQGMNVSQIYGYRPAFIIPSDTYIDENNNILTAPPYNAISTLNVGDSVFCKENGVDAEYLLVHKGLPSSMYDASCNGAWLLRKNTIKQGAYAASSDNIYAESDVNTYLNGAFLNLFSVNMKNVIQQVNIPYVTSGQHVASGGNGLSVKSFLLSYYEVGGTNNDSRAYVDGSKLDYFMSGTSLSANGVRSLGNIKWWLRSPSFDDGTYARIVGKNGTLAGNNSSTTTNYYRPAFIVPLETPIDSSNNIIA